MTDRNPPTTPRSAEELAAWLEKIAAGYDPVGPCYAEAAAMLRKLSATQSETAALAPAAAYVLAIQQSVGSILSQYSANKILDRAKEIANGH